MSPRKDPPSLSRPLMVRPGARFTCFSDGLCCSDIHALGPLTRSEVKAVKALVPDSVEYHEGVEDHCMRTGEDGFCAQREAGLCGIHKKFGAAAKPSGCRRFPYGLLTTPEGGRITTEHRCPCRTLGDRPPLNVLDAEKSLSTLSGRIEPDHRVPDRVPVAANRFVSFARYREAEAPMIERLLKGERAEDVLDAKVLPEPHFGSWPGFAGELYELKDHTAGGASICWFADALMFLCEGHVAPKRPRPWADSFERAIARSSERQDPEQIINDWVADELWMMRWLDWDCTFDVARAELATRVAMVRHIIDRLRKQKVRADQAAAEAVMIVEIGAANESWTEVVDSIANSPSPASELFPKTARRASR